MRDVVATSLSRRSLKKLSSGMLAMATAPSFAGGPERNVSSKAGIEGGGAAGVLPWDEAELRSELPSVAKVLGINNRCHERARHSPIGRCSHGASRVHTFGQWFPRGWRLGLITITSKVRSYA